MFVQSMSMFGKKSANQEVVEVVCLSELSHIFPRKVSVKSGSLNVAVHFFNTNGPTMFRGNPGSGPKEWNSYPPAHVPLEETPELFKELAITMLCIYNIYIYVVIFQDSKVYSIIMIYQLSCIGYTATKIQDSPHFNLQFHPQFH